MKKPLALLAAVLLLAGSAAAQPTLNLTQPSGPGSFQLDVTGLSSGDEMFNLISLVPHDPVGEGPFFGLSITGSILLFQQLLSPLGAHPFHVTADVAGNYSFAFANPSVVGVSIPIDAVTVHWDPILGVQGISTVVFANLSF